MSHPSSSSFVSFSTEIAFVDAGIADSASLIAQFQASTEVHLLDSSQAAIDQITQILSTRSNISAVHLVSHGSNGALQLGGDTISDLSEYIAELKLWSNSLTADADILLYGCNVAADGTGQALVNQLSQLTGADVAASDDLTGLGGDWQLEYQTGSIETAAIADDAYKGTLANFFVTSTSDVVDVNDGVLTLREAIIEANTQPDTDNIFFSVNGTITLTGGELAISGSNLNIYGNGASFLTISGNNTNRVFNIGSSNVLLSGLTIANGRVAGAGDDGGGIRNTSNLTVQFCTFSSNSADRFGGGIDNEGNLTVNRSSFSNNSANFFGGGIRNRGILTVSSSSFSGNSASNSGGGIANFGILTVNGSSFSDNSADRFGGGIDNFGTLTVNSSGFSNNSATFGGGIANSGGTMTVTGSYFLNNQASNSGGGIANRFNGFGGTSTLVANVISQNRATNQGGGVFTDAGTVYLQLNNISFNTASTGTDLFGAVLSGTSTPGSVGFNVIGKGGGFTGITNGVNGDVILVP
ncbi:DUF4347 domain-containing protein [Leptolyngbya sp. NK1-12]|uniref:DUF4347 domain-containing protein n=1 Tax=Leptolyngbya sp. NK1-12 TaxID=2547451 RepID=A0AA96WF17_9CYAN|nr:DUF4347 domain-containing protein [Leptolyngbya sp. NK1-12]